MTLRRLTVAARPLGIIGLAVLTALGCGGGSSSSTPGVPSEPPPGPGECEEFDGAFDAIQSVVFERRGCTAEACHGSTASGGLDLRAESAYANLVGVPSTGSSLRRVDPGRVKDS